MLSEQKSCRRLLQQWRRQIGGSARHGLPPFLRHRAIVGYFPRSRADSHLIDVRDLVISVLHFETRRNRKQVLRLKGFTGSKIPWGVKLGGRDNSLFDKDLNLVPACQARGKRLDLRREEVLFHGLDLHRRLFRSARSSRANRVERLRLPKFWAAFRPEQVENIYADGPEVEKLSERLCQDPVTLLKRYCRQHHGYVLYPLNWVSQHWEQTATVFADPDHFPKFQNVRMRCMHQELHRFRSACEFDFRRTRFQRQKRQRDRLTQSRPAA